MEEEIEKEAGHAPRPRGRHIKKRALKNKALSVSFKEKDLRDYVTGFHKRKKKRRKEARQKLEEAQRRKRIEERKKRKLEEEFILYGGTPPVASTEPGECGEDSEQDEGSDPIPSVSGTTTYDNGDIQVVVTTSEISREEEVHQSDMTEAAIPRSVGVAKKKQHSVPVSKKKPFKRVAKHKSQGKPQNKRDKKKGKKRNRNMH